MIEATLHDHGTVKRKQVQNDGKQRKGYLYMNI